MVKWQEYERNRLPAGALSRTQIGTLRTMGWDGGWQADKPTSHVAINELDFVKNYNWTEGYTLQRRGGHERVTTSVAGLEAAEQLHIMNVETAASLTAQPSFTQEVLNFNDTDSGVWYATLGDLLEEERDSTGADLAYSGQAIGPWDKTLTNYFRTFSIQSVVFEEFIYITSLRFGGFSGASTIETHDGNAAGASKPIKYDVLNDTWTRPVPHALDGTTSGFPSARCAIAEYDRIFVANIYKMSGYRYPSRIYWSDAGTAETFQSDSFIEVGIDDGSEITQLLPLGDAILVFKNDKTYMLLGTDEDTFLLRNISPRFGTRSSQGAVEHKGKAYFFDQSNGLMSYDGANFVNVSEPINKYMLTQIGFNREADFKVNVQNFGNRIFVSLPIGLDIDDIVARTFVYNVDLKVWTQWYTGISSHIREAQTDHSYTGVGLAGQGDAFFGSPEGEIGLFRLEGDVSEDELVGGDRTVVAQMDTGWLTPGELGSRHRLRRLDLLTGSLNESNCDLTMYRDFNATNAWQTATFDPDGALDAWHHQDVSFNDSTMFTWTQMKIIQDQGTNLVANILGYQMSISSRIWQRGKQGSLNQAP